MIKIMLKNRNQQKALLSNKNIWDSISFTREELDDASLALIEKFSFTHVNGGMKIHKYNMKSNHNIEWAKIEHRVNERDFLMELLKHEDLKEFREALGITIKNLERNIVLSHSTDIFNLSGDIARNLFQGGAYRSINCVDAWNIANLYVEKSFQNRFDEILFITTSIYEEPNNWFYDVAWDCSWILIDKGKNCIVLISITDTD